MSWEKDKIMEFYKNREHSKDVLDNENVFDEGEKYLNYRDSYMDWVENLADRKPIKVPKFKT